MDSYYCSGGSCGSGYLVDDEEKRRVISGTGRRRRNFASAAADVGANNLGKTVELSQLREFYFYDTI